MNDPKKRFLIRLYFTRLQVKPALVLLGLGLLFSSTRPGLWILGVGAVYSATLIAAAIARPSDKQIDRWLGEDVGQLRKKALEMLDLDEDDLEIDDPLQLAGPLTHATNMIRKEDVRIRRGRDRCYRLSANKVLILCPTAHYLGVFHCVYDSLRDQVFHSVATEYAYRNVVAVKRGESAEVFKGDEPNVLTTRTGKELLPTQFFSLSISNGERFTVPMRARVAEARASGEPRMTELDRVYIALKKLLQSKFEAA